MSNLKWLYRSGVTALVVMGFSTTATAQSVINAKYETKGYFDAEFDADSDADDPAIWVHPTTKSKSLVIASLKNGGAAVFNLQGVELQRIYTPAGPTPDDESGRYNNADLLYNFSVSGTNQDLVVFSDRGRDVLEIYRINKSYGGATLPLTRVTASNVPYVYSSNQEEVNDQRTAYGLATHNFGGSTGAIGFVTQRERAKLAKVKFASAAGGKVTYSVVGYQQFPSTFTMPNGAAWTPCMDEDGVEAQFEGLVIDKDANKLYAGQEPVGIWRMNLDFSNRVLVEKVKTYGQIYTREGEIDEEGELEYECEYTSDPGFGGTKLAPDVEGLTIYYSPIDSAERLLFASSQGDNTFHVWDIDDGQWEYEDDFFVTFGADLNEESDGSHIVSAALDSGDYSMGLFVSQDGDNTPEVLDEEGEAIAQTNFKFTPAKRIINTLGLDID